MLPGAHTGQLITMVLVEQFEALRDGAATSIAATSTR
jgi:hypothetical protein